MDTRIDLMFTADGKGCEAFGKTLAEDILENRTQCGGENDDPPISHVNLEAPNDNTADSGCKRDAIVAMLAIQHLEIQGRKDVYSTLEALATLIFRAGMEHQKTIQGDSQ